MLNQVKKYNLWIYHFFHHAVISSVQIPMGTMGHCDVTIASGWPKCRWRHNRPSAVNFEMILAPGSGKIWIYVSYGTGIMYMIGAPNSLNLNCKVRVIKEAPGPSVSEEIADIFRNYNIDNVYNQPGLNHNNTQQSMNIAICLFTMSSTLLFLFLSHELHSV